MSSSEIVLFTLLTFAVILAIAAYVGLWRAERNISRVSYLEHFAKPGDVLNIIDYATVEGKHIAFVRGGASLWAIDITNTSIESFVIGNYRAEKTVVDSGKKYNRIEWSLVRVERQDIMLSSSTPKAT